MAMGCGHAWYHHGVALRQTGSFRWRGIMPLDQADCRCGQEGSLAMARNIHFKNGWVMRAPLHAGGAQRIMET
jgi:hypothetical protein